MLRWHRARTKQVCWQRERPVSVNGLEPTCKITLVRAESLEPRLNYFSGTWHGAKANVDNHKFRHNRSCYLSWRQRSVYFTNREFSVYVGHQVVLSHEKLGSLLISPGVVIGWYLNAKHVAWGVRRPESVCCRTTWMLGLIWGSHFPQGYTLLL